MPLREAPRARSAAPARAARHGRRARLSAGILAAAALLVAGGVPAHAAVASGRLVRLLGSDDAWTPAAAATGPGSMAFIAHAVGADDAWRYGVTGAGVDIALIDSGVSGVAGLARSGKVVNGPDLSFDLQAGAAPYEDTFGHGTHLAGIMAGRDDGGAVGHAPAKGSFAGIAPDARIVNVKVAGSAGQTDVSQVIAAIDWVVQHRDADGLHIRVLNLAFGTDAVQDYRVDPLARAVESAWEHGIVVVIAAGNAGAGPAGLADPAVDPFVIAVGAGDPQGSSRASDDTVPAWSSRGDGVRNPDLVAPGVSVRSLRVPGSSLDAAVPAAPQDPRFIGGSGTSQAAAVVSGAVALVLADRPDLTPDQVKALLMDTASPMPLADAQARGAGLVDVEHALESHARPAASVVATWERSTGTGSLDAARGSSRVAVDGIPLDGERDVFGAPFDGAAWAAASARGAAWDGGTWNGHAWAGTCWCATSWAGLSWSGLSWSGLSWSGLSWSGLSWSSAVAPAANPLDAAPVEAGSAGWTTVAWDAD